MRKQSEMLQLFPAYLKGEDLFGLTVSAVARIAESVSASASCGVGIAFLIAFGGSQCDCFNMGCDSQDAEEALCPCIGSWRSSCLSRHL